MFKHLPQKNKKLVLCNFIFFICLPIFIYLKIFHGSGIYSDDFNEIINHNNLTVQDYFSQNLAEIKRYAFGVPNYFGLFWSFVVFKGELLFGYSLIKFIVHLACVYFTYKFFTIYFDKKFAILSSVLFIFFPLHDTTQHWYMTLAYIIAPALLFYAYYLITINLRLLALVFAFLGSFFFYTSPPYFIGLFVILLFKKEYKNSLVFLIPGIFYIAYYFFIRDLVAISDLSGDRISNSISFLSFAKNLGLQILTITEASVGLSPFLKFYIALSHLKIIDLLILIFLMATLFKYFLRDFSFKHHGNFKDLYLLGSIILVIAIFNYSLTGSYWHNAINLANRSLIYPSFLLTILIASSIRSRSSFLIISILLLAINLGLSNHWKYWHSSQQQVVENVFQNKELNELNDQDILIVKGNGYSKFGNFDNIEFLVAPWVTRSVFQNKSGSKIPLTSYLSLKENKIIDEKWDREYEIHQNIYLYDTQLDEVHLLSPEELSLLFKENNVPPQRHWIQHLRNTTFGNFIKSHVPSISYLLE